MNKTREDVLAAVEAEAVLARQELERQACNVVLARTIVEEVEAAPEEREVPSREAYTAAEEGLAEALAMERGAATIVREISKRGMIYIEKERYAREQEKHIDELEASPLGRLDGALERFSASEDAAAKGSHISKLFLAAREAVSEFQNRLLEEREELERRRTVLAESDSETLADLIVADAKLHNAASETAKLETVVRAEKKDYEERLGGERWNGRSSLSRAQEQLQRAEDRYSEAQETAVQAEARLQALQAEGGGHGKD